MGNIINNVKVYDLAESIAASGYPMRTETDTELKSIDEAIENEIFGDDEGTYSIFKRACSLGNSTGGHDQYLTGIRVAFDVTFTNKVWVEAERYRFFEFVSSQSTMHRIAKFDIGKLCNEYVDKRVIRIVKEKIKEYNLLCEELKSNNTEELSNKVKEAYLSILYNVPAGLKVTARITTNYRCLKNIYAQRRDHRLPEWREFCEEIECLPYFKELCLKAYDRD